MFLNENIGSFMQTMHVVVIYTFVHKTCVLRKQNSTEKKGAEKPTFIFN